MCKRLKHYLQLRVPKVAEFLANLHPASAFALAVEQWMVLNLRERIPLFVG